MRDCVYNSMEINFKKRDLNFVDAQLLAMSGIIKGTTMR